MAHVTLIGNLRHLTGGTATLELEVATVQQLFRALAERYPEFAAHTADGLAVAINGQIFQDALFQDIPPNAEVHILPQIAGG